MKRLGMKASRPPSGFARGPLCAALLATASLSIAACGGSSSTSSSGASASGANQSALGGPHTATAGTHPDVVSNGVVVHHPLHGTGGKAINDDNPGRADSGHGTAPGQLNPCTLVSRARAQAIIGRPIAAPQEAPLGPTCIYQPRGAAETITLTVETLALSQATSQMHGRTRVQIAGHTAYCGIYGQRMTLVALTGGRVLAIAAPCAVGARLAAAALPRLKA